MYYKCIFIFVVQSLSRVWLFATPWTVACQASLSFTICWSLLKLMFIESVMPFNLDDAIQRKISSSVAPLSPCSQSFPASLFFQWVGSSHQVAKGLGLHFSISPSNEYSGLIFFRMDWFDLFAVQGTLKSPLQHDGSKASKLCMHTNIHRPATNVCTYTHVILTYLDTNISR